MVLLQVMYTDLDFTASFNIEAEVLQHFLFEVYRRYNNIPFHNFKHCFCVTQMVSVAPLRVRSEVDVSSGQTVKGPEIGKLVFAESPSAVRIKHGPKSVDHSAPGMENVHMYKQGENQHGVKKKKIE